MKSFLLIVLCLLIVGCQRGYPPVILNNSTAGIEVTVTFDDGSGANEIGLAPDTAFLQNRQGLQIREIKAKDASGRLRTYGFAELSNARANRNIKFEVWILSNDAIRLGDETDYRDFLRTKKA